MRLEGSRAGATRIFDTVTHVVFATHAGNLDAAAAFWSVLGVSFEDFTRTDLGLRILFSWTHGVEIIAPVEPFGPSAQRLSEFLREKGEGFFAANYGVRDLDDTIRRVVAAGISCSRLAQTMTGREPWFGRFITCEEARPGLVAGMSIMFIDVESVEPPPVLGRICEAAFCLAPDARPAAASFWSDVLGVAWLPPISVRAGECTRYAPVAGLHLLTPDADAASPDLADFLERTGGGGYSATFRVGDLDSAISAARSGGIGVIDRIDWPAVDGSPPRREAMLEAVAGMRVILAEIAD